MAYNKLEKMITLATELQASSIGLTIHDMMLKTESSRKTVERMLNNLYQLGLEPKHSHLDDDHHLTKRWRIEAGVPLQLLQLKSEERSALERHLQTLKKNLEANAIKKLLAGQRPLGRALAVNTAELIDRTSHINKIGPQLKVNESHMVKIEDGILGFQTLNIKYRSKGQKRSRYRDIEPLGLLFGRFGYLVANNAKTKMQPYTYRLDLIEEVKESKIKGMFQVPSNWNFKIWARDSFGVFHGDEKLDVKIRFIDDAAKRADKIQFHPSQKITKLSNRITIIEFKVRGHRELIHELLHPDWLGQVFIEHPNVLKKEFEAYLSKAKSAVI